MADDDFGDDGFGDDDFGDDGFGDDDAGGDDWGDADLVDGDDVDAADEYEAAPKEEPKKFSLASGDPLDKCFKFSTAAFGKIPKRQAPEKAKVLSDAKVKEIILKTLPDKKKEISSTRDARPIVDMIASAYAGGLFTLGKFNSPVNSQVVPALHYIFHVCGELSKDDPKRKYLLKTLCEAMHDCQQVQAREVLRLFGDLTNQSQTFEEQVQYFLLKQKEEAMDRFIGMYHKNCDEGHDKVKPWQQRAHLKSGYIDLLGDDLGFEAVEAARTDRFLKEVQNEITGTAWGDVDKKVILMMLKKELSVERFMYGVLSDINNQSPNADRLINRDCIFKWVQTKLSLDEAHGVFWNEERSADYAGLTPTRPTEENLFQPFLAPKFLLKCLEQTGFIERT